jgi:membrane protein
MADPLKKIVDRIKNLNEKIWTSSPKAGSGWESFFLKQLKILFLAGRGFSNDKVQLRASALTFYSLLSLVPVIAIGFAIAKGFGLDKDLEELIMQNVNTIEQYQVVSDILYKGRSALEQTSGGYIAGVGIIILLWSVMSLLENIEQSFNYIFQVRVPRPWYRKITDYFSILLIAPVFIVLSSSLTVFISTKLTEFMSAAPILAFFKPVISFLIKFAPYLLSWITMTILFIIMPNTKVRFGPAVISGIITGTILHLLQWLYIDLQWGIAKLNTIYGSFAAIPLFIIWLQSTWIVVLIGAELTYANQNIKRFELEFESLNISHQQRRALVLMIMKKIIHNFSVGDKAVSTEQIASELNIPVRLTREILQDLNSIHLVSQIQENTDEQCYQPGLDINKLTISYVFSKMDDKGESKIKIEENEDYGRIIRILDEFDNLVEKSGRNVLIKDL